MKIIEPIDQIHAESIIAVENIRRQVDRIRRGINRWNITQEDLNESS